MSPDFCISESDNFYTVYVISDFSCLILTWINQLPIAVIFILVNQWIGSGSTEMFEHSQLVGNTWAWAYPALCVSCGYFAYDQWDMLRYRLYSGWIPSILVHHLVLLVCFTLALYRNVTINYLILTLICEVCLFIFLSVLFNLFVSLRSLVLSMFWNWH